MYYILLQLEQTLRLGITRLRSRPDEDDNNLSNFFFRVSVNYIILNSFELLKIFSLPFLDYFKFIFLSSI